MELEKPQPATRSRRRALMEIRKGGGAPIVGGHPSKITAVEPSTSAPAVQPRREKRAARHANRRLAGHSRGYFRAMRAGRYAYRPIGRSRGIVARLFGWF